MLSALVRVSRAARGAAAAVRVSAAAPAAARPVALVKVAAVRGMATAPEMTLREAINSAIDEEMERDPTVFIMGAWRSCSGRRGATGSRAGRKTGGGES
jgi:hypothetical protein